MARPESVRDLAIYVDPGDLAAPLVLRLDNPALTLEQQAEAPDVFVKLVNLAVALSDFRQSMRDEVRRSREGGAS
jgi:hypothetical protein